MRKAGILAAFAMLSAGSVLQGQANPRVYSPQFESTDEQNGDAPAVQLWLDEKSYRSGDIIRPYVVAEPGAYVTVIRVSTDGELRVLYPQRPSSQRRHQAGEFANDRLPMTGDPSFYLNESTGNGFVFAIASFDRFDYSYYSAGNQWSYARLANASRYGSPFQIARSFVEEITNGATDYAMDYVMYDVDGRQYRSRYASRYRGYDYYDYMDLCLNAFGSWYSSYCRAYNGGYYGPFIIVHYPSTPYSPAARKGMRVKPVVPDPALPHVPLTPQPVEGRFPVNDPAEAAASARRERMLRDARPRIEPRTQPAAEPRVYRPEPAPIVRSSPRSEPRGEPRSEPRVEQRRPEPRVEQRRAEPQTPARVEVRNEPRPQPPPARRAEPSRVERPQKDNQ